MSVESNEARQLLRSIWDAQGQSEVDLDEDCNPNKICRNMKEVTFEGFAEEGGDLKTAWRNTLSREGKISTGGSLGDLVHSITEQK